MGIGFGELIVILLIALVIFGPAKLPGVGSALGKTIREFKKTMNGDFTDPPKADISEKTDAAQKADADTGENK